MRDAIRPLTALLVCGLALTTACSSNSDSPGAAPSHADTSQIRATAVPPCDRYASPQGFRHGTGSRSRPFNSLRRLVRSLRPGEAGCLMAGRYVHRGVVQMTRPGTTLRPLGNARATIDGAIWVMPKARGARVTGLGLTSHDPVFTIPLKVQADRVQIVGNEITASRSISCVLIGSDRTVSGLLLERNRIRRCGRRGKLDHLIYVVHSRGAVIRKNLLVDNRGGWAVHLYPDADGTLVEANVIDSNEGGVIFGGDGRGDTSDGNVVRENVITNSAPRWNIESSWSGGPEGAGNRAERNCVYSSGPGRPSGIGFGRGFRQSGNVVANGKVYVDARAGNYRLRPGSNCGAVLMDVGGVALRAGRN